LFFRVNDVVDLLAALCMYRQGLCKETTQSWENDSEEGLARFELCMEADQEPGSSVSIVSDNRLDDRATGVRSPAEVNNFFL
jgi:hypothetical protein